MGRLPYAPKRALRKKKRSLPFQKQLNKAPFLLNLYVYIFINTHKQFFVQASFFLTIACTLETFEFIAKTHGARI